MRTPYEELKNCALCYTFIKEVYRSNDLQSNTEEIVVSFSPKETLTFTTEPKVVKPIFSFIQNHGWYVIAIFSSKYGSKNCNFFILQFFFSLRSFHPNEVSALKIQNWQDLLNKKKTASDNEKEKMKMRTFKIAKFWLNSFEAFSNFFFS